MFSTDKDHCCLGRSLENRFYFHAFFTRSSPSGFSLFFLQFGFSAPLPFWMLRHLQAALCLRAGLTFSHPACRPLSPLASLFRFQATLSPPAVTNCTCKGHGLQISCSRISSTFLPAGLLTKFALRAYFLVWFSNTEGRVVPISIMNVIADESLTVCLMLH